MTVTFDTNVLVYALDPGEGRRRERAAGLVRRVLRQRQGVLLLQVMAEFYAVATRKLGTSPIDARRFLEGLRTAWLPLPPPRPGG